MLVNSSEINTGSFELYGHSERNKVKATPGARPAPGAPKQRMTRKGGCG